jgi:hypothetical protein
LQNLLTKMTESKTAIQWESIADIKERPNYFRGMVKHENWSASISALRSWQHKESRRVEKDTTLLEQCVMLQAYSGFILASFQYFLHTIVPEDIGLANPCIIMPMSTCLARWERYFLPKTTEEKKKVWPIPKKILQEALSDLLQTCKIVGYSPKNRFVPSFITIALMHHVKNGWSYKENTWSSRLKHFQRSVESFHPPPCQDSIDTKKIIDEHIRPIAIAMENCLLYIDWIKKSNKNKNELFMTPEDTKLSKMHYELTSVIRKPRQKYTELLDTIVQLNKTKHTRLWYYMMLFIRIFPFSNTTPILLETFQPEDLDQTFSRLFPSDKPLPKIPEYALDKHVGKSGGYKRFQTEGIYVPPEKIWMAELNQQLSDEAFQLRFDYEAKHGTNSSKTQKVIDQIMAENQKRIQKRPHPEGDIETVLLEPSKKKPKKTQKSEKTEKPRSNLPKMQPILDAPVGQPVTGRSKKYVYIYPEVVKKGPYLKKDKKRVDFTLKATQLIDTINTQQGVETTVIFPFLEVQPDNSIFVCWKNIGKYDQIKTEQRTTKLAEDVKVVSRKSLVYRASDVEPTKLSDQLVQSCLNHLYARAIVAVGDSGLWNILIADYEEKNGKIHGKIVGIDLEEERSFKNLPTSKMQFLFSRPTNIDFWKSQLKHVKQLSMEWAKQNLDPPMIERVELFSTFTE